MAIQPLRRGRSVAALVPLLLLALSASAAAAPRADVPVMLELATAHLGPAPCPALQVHWRPSGSLNNAGEAGVVARGALCQIWLDETYFDSAPWSTACQVVVHEYGHNVRDDWDEATAGVQVHSPDPMHVMNDGGKTRFRPCELADPKRDCWQVPLLNERERHLRTRARVLEKRAQRLALRMRPARRWLSVGRRAESAARQADRTTALLWALQCPR